MSDFHLSVRSLKRTAGAAKPFTLTGCYGTPVATGLIGLPGDREVAVTGDLEAVGDGVLVRAQASTTIDAQCARCLTAYSYPVTVPVEELYVYAERDEEYRDEAAGRITDEAIDLGDAVRDAIILEQPLAPLCQAECRGLCPACGADLNADPAHDHGAPPDARWLGLNEWGKMSGLPTEISGGQE